MTTTLDIKVNSDYDPCEKGGIMPSDAYWAGFFDAEGCVSVDDVTLVVQVTQSTLNILTLLKDRFQGHIDNMPNRKEECFAWKWAAKSSYALDLVYILDKYVLEKFDQMNLVRDWQNFSSEEKRKRSDILSELNHRLNVPIKSIGTALSNTQLEDSNTNEYIAGFFDGDGSVGIYQNSKNGKPYGKPKLRVTFGQVNPASVIFIHLLRGGTSTPKKTPHRNQTKLTFLEDDALNFIKSIQSNVVTKRDEIDLVLSLWNSDSLDSRFETMDKLNELRTIKKSYSLSNYKLWVEAGEPVKWIPPDETEIISLATEIKPRRTPKRDRVKDLLTDTPISTTEITMRVFGNVEPASRFCIHTTLAKLKKLGLAESYKHGYWQRPDPDRKPRIFMKDLSKRVLDTLQKEGVCSTKKLTELINPPNPLCLNQALSRFKRRGAIETKHGLWQLSAERLNHE